MRTKKDLNHLPPAPPTPPEYEEDFEWALKNMDEIAHNYPDQWVAIVNKQVVAAGKKDGRVMQEAEKKTGRKEFPIFFVEEDMRFYANQLAVRCAPQSPAFGARASGTHRACDDSSSLLERHGLDTDAACDY